ncbi:GNAT family N-acetyltransferase [Sulfitobacter geojensis]|uniref:GNAT family N-acetyltransferase n=1 Tax=Sulfitobacter geojensis TaxID=1342299 RepID=UPI0036DCDF04
MDPIDTDLGSPIHAAFEGPISKESCIDSAYRTDGVTSHAYPFGFRDETTDLGRKQICAALFTLTDHDGEVLLNYVLPDARFSGVSIALLESLENVAVEVGCRECVLDSTKTAKKFYESCGYKSTNETSLTLAKQL